MNGGAADGISAGLIEVMRSHLGIDGGRRYRGRAMARIGWRIAADQISSPLCAASAASAYPGYGCGCRSVLPRLHRRRGPPTVVRWRSPAARARAAVGKR